jgi:hypothetical protein
MFQWIFKLFQNDQKQETDEQDKYSSQPATIFEALQKLGSTEEEVFNYLVANNWKGIKTKPHACPVANYLKNNRINIDPGIASRQNGIMIGYQWFQADGVSKFIISFDEGKYPELEIKC